MKDPLIQDFNDGLEIKVRFIVLEMLIKLSEKQRFISFRDGYWFREERMIDFPDSSAVYVKLLKALFFTSDSQGFCSYQNINTYLEQNGERPITKKEEQRKRILNARENLFRSRKGQKEGFPEVAPDGNSTIRIEKNKGLILYNPKIDQGGVPSATVNDLHNLLNDIKRLKEK